MIYDTTLLMLNIFLIILLGSAIIFVLSMLLYFLVSFLLPLINALGESYSEAVDEVDKQNI